MQGEEAQRPLFVFSFLKEKQEVIGVQTKAGAIESRGGQGEERCSKKDIKETTLRCPNSPF